MASLGFIAVVVCALISALVIEAAVVWYYSNQRSTGGDGLP